MIFIKDSYNTFAKNLRVMAPVFDIFLANVCVGFIESMSSHYLQNVIGATQTQIGWFFLTYGITYSLSSFVAGYVSRNGYTIDDCAS